LLWFYPGREEGRGKAGAKEVRQAEHFNDLNFVVVCTSCFICHGALVTMDVVDLLVVWDIK
jgi:hypothetical protein